ncbi:MAG: LysM peptidoglycan-binding domain-containing protein [Methanothrix sp.]|nr:LysM peptidoglycan-binding domain-containing protein [Methanothrix sp.]
MSFFETRIDLKHVELWIDAEIPQASSPQFAGSLNGYFYIGSFGIYLSASYDSTAGWEFKGNMLPGDVIPLGDLINDMLKEIMDEEDFKRYFPDPLKLDIKDFALSARPAFKTEKASYHGECKVDLKHLRLEPLGSVDVKARLSVNYDDNKLTDKLSGNIEFDACLEDLDIIITVGYNFGKKELSLKWKGLTVIAANGEASLELSGYTLGGIIETFVSWATGYKFGLVPPWDLLDKIRLNDFKLVFNFETKKISFNIAIGPIELGFGRIDGISVAYDPNGEKKVNVEIAGSFFVNGEKKDSLGWDATKPEQTPAPSGGKYFDLRLLALGQHVSIMGSESFNSVEEAITAMESLKEPKDDEIPLGSTAKPGSPYFNPDSSWLVAMDFGVLKLDKTAQEIRQKSMAIPSQNALANQENYLLSLALIFNDPNLYALRIVLAKNAKAKIFSGLEFEILYRRISDTVGVWQTELKLPDSMRSFEVGVFTITLPILALQVYTNGDFKVDLGFPWNMDFSRSFMIQGVVPPGIPVLGAGGLYFGKLSSATSNQVPKAVNGSFNPVIIFGIGLQLGVGKYIEKGLLKAGFSITAIGILEGVIAQWHPNTPDSGSIDPKGLQDGYYFWLQGTFGIAGKLFGSVDFSVVKAAVNVSISIFAQITFESYADIPISVIASVKISLTIKINLGLFSIKIDLKFSASIKETFTISNPRKKDDAPWKLKSGLQKSSSNFKRASRIRSSYNSFLSAREAPSTSLNWSNYRARTSKIALDGLFVPTLSACDSKPCYVAMLFIDSAASFRDLCRQVLMWVVAAKLPESGTGYSEEDISGKVVSEEYLLDILETCLVSKKDAPLPIPVQEIDNFMKGQFALTIRNLTKKNLGMSKDAPAFTVFPMPPDLILHVPFFNGEEEINYRFSERNKVDEASLDNLRTFFDALAVQVEQEMNEQNSLFRLNAADVKYTSMASFVFQDYFLLLARQMIQYAKDSLRNFKYQIADGDSINKILDWAAKRGCSLSAEGAINAEDIVLANDRHKLNTGEIWIEEDYAVLSGDTLADIAASFSLDPQSLASFNADEELLQVGNAIRYHDRKDVITIEAGDTLGTIAERLKITLNELIEITDVSTGVGTLKKDGNLKLPAIVYAASSSDSLSSVAGKYTIGPNRSKIDVEDLAMRNAWVKGMLRSGTDLGLVDQSTGKNVVTSGSDSLGSLARLAGISVEDLAKKDKVKNAPLTPLYALMLPPISYQIADGDTLDSISRTFGLPVGKLARSTRNLDHHDIFSKVAPAGATKEEEDEAAWLNLPHLMSLNVSTLLQHFQSIGGPNELSGMVSRYMLHGTRLPYKRMTQSVSQDQTLQSIVEYNENLFRLRDLVIINADAKGILETGAAIKYKDATGGDKTYEIQSNDTFRSVASSIGKALGSKSFTLVDLAENTDIGKSKALVPDSRIILPRIKFQPQHDESVEMAGLYELTGQQFILPDLSAPGEYLIEIENAEPAVQWVGFDGGVSELKVVIKDSNGKDENRIVKDIQAVKDLLDHNWRPVTEKIGQEQTFLSQLRKYTFPSMTVWQSLSEVRLPCTVSEAEVSRQLLRIWSLPDSLIDLPLHLGSGVGKVKMSVKTGTFNDATSAMDQENVRSYCWGTSVDFGIKRPKFSNSKSGETYELIGASEQGISLLDRLLNMSGTGSKPIRDLVLLYRPEQAGSAHGGLQSDGQVTIFICKVNLTTDTHPPNMLKAEVMPVENVDQTANCLNGFIGFVRLLWENSITRTGGYYLYYRNDADGSGLPDRIFNDKGEAMLSLLIIYDEPEYSTNPAAGSSFADYVNCAVTGDLIDPARSTVFAEPVYEADGLNIRIAAMPPGTIPIGATRKIPEIVPDSSDDEDFGELYLENMFTLLGYSIDGNSIFRASGSGLPMGPAKPDQENEGFWLYHQAVPYSKLASCKPEPILVQGTAIESPYAGVAGSLQARFSWHDLFGNVLKGADQQNGSEIQLGYTDPLIGLSRWPGVSCHYRIMPGDSSLGQPKRLLLEFTFDPSRYTMVKNAFDAEPSPSEINQLKKIAWHDLLTYARIYFQLLGTAKMQDTKLSIDTSLLRQIPAGKNEELEKHLCDWIWKPGGPKDPTIISYLDSCISYLDSYLISGFMERESKPEPVPPENFEFEIEIDLDNNVNSALIFKLYVALKLERKEFIHPDFAKESQVTSISTLISPLVASNDSAGSLGAGRSLAEFAQQFESTMSVPGSFKLKIATGLDRYKDSEPAIWVMRLDQSPAQTIAENTIGFRINDKGSPRIFAPRPISNRPESVTNVDIHDYASGSGEAIDLTKEGTKTMDFVGVDVDLWLKELLAAIDDFLIPEVVSSAVLVDKSLDDGSLVGRLIDCKEKLAEKISMLMIPLFIDQTNEGQEDAREAFKQQMLVRLSNAYSVEAAIQFPAQVKVPDEAPVEAKMGVSHRPRLYGTAVMKGESARDVSLTSAKLASDGNDRALLTLLMQEKYKEKTSDQEGLENMVKLDLWYQVSHLEHQIEELTTGYVASSWLSFAYTLDMKETEQSVQHVLGSDLGAFDVPLVLRSLPTPPSMISQNGNHEYSDGSLRSALSWDYSFTYARSYHDPQDKLMFTVELNKTSNPVSLMKKKDDLLSSLAEFVAVYPAIKKDFDEVLKGLDMTIKANVDVAKAAISSFVDLVGQVEEAFAVHPASIPDKLVSGKFNFFIQEAPSYGLERSENGDLCVQMDIENSLPDDIGEPYVKINGWMTELMPNDQILPKSLQKFKYKFYKENDSSRTYLSKAEGRKISDRLIVLPKLNILKHQDARALACLRRNEGSVEREIACEFKYQTSEVSFSDPYRPLLHVFDIVDISKIGSPNGSQVRRTLNEHLWALFFELFYDAQKVRPMNGARFMVQIECSYEFALIDTMGTINVPVLLMPLAHYEDKLAGDLSASIKEWTDRRSQSETGGHLCFDLTIISEIGDSSMPLLWLHRLKLPMNMIS